MQPAAVAGAVLAALLASAVALWGYVERQCMVGGRTRQCMVPDHAAAREAWAANGRRPVELSRAEAGGALLPVVLDASRRGVPTVVRGGAAHWPSHGRWSAAYLAEALGADDWLLLQSGTQEQHSAPFVNTTWGAFAAHLRKHDSLESVRAYRARTGLGPLYLSEEFETVESSARLVRDVGGFADFAGGLGVSETALWVGAAGARSGWHADYDFAVNALVHVKGPAKKMWLAPPWEHAAMYPSRRYDPGALLSSVDGWAPDADVARDHPLHAALLPIEPTVIEPGDVVLIPPLWWHRFEGGPGPGEYVSLSVRLHDTPLQAFRHACTISLVCWLLDRGLYNPGEGSVVYDRVEAYDVLG